MATSKRRPGSSKATTKATDDASAPHLVERSDPGARPVGMVVVACSPSGFGACAALLSQLPVALGLAFVVVVHPEDGVESDAIATVRAATRMPVQLAEPGAALVADAVCVVLHDRGWVLEGDRLAPSEKQQYRSMPVDLFLRSAAANPSVPIITVVLNGISSDGTLGLEAVKAEGGITFAQAVDGTTLDSMPRSAIGSGVVDFVLEPAAIAAEIANLAAKLAAGGDTTLAEDSDRARDEEMRRVFSLLRTGRGVDFSQYRQTTIRRRIVRRMLLQRIGTLADYARFMREHPEEVDALFQDMLIRVTSFFRDPEVFDVLRTRVFPELIKGRDADDPIRIWVPGCASGEEAYSLAIALLESITDVRTATPLQLFATDISEAAIEKARAGIYPNNIALDVSAERLRRFFVKVDRGYQIDKTIRDMCVVARQNVTSDPPFSRIDLVSCRNLLIYLEPPLQRRVIPIFHYALKRNGYLLLGTSETTGSLPELFTPFDKKHKVYIKAKAATVPTLDFGSAGQTARVLGTAPERPARPRDPSVELDRDVDRAIMTRYAPPGVVVDQDHQIVQFRGYTGAYLEPAPGEASLNVFKMAREGLLIELRSALHRAQTTQEPVRTGVLSIRSTGDTYRDVVLQILPLRVPQRDANEVAMARHYLVLFETPFAAEPIEHDGPPPPPADPANAPLLEKLKHELASTREYLQSIIEEQEATNEELQSANEEILSSNEELQSINEELETAKEELQSTNEELTTVNEELQNRNQELLLANSDLYNSLASVNLPIVMLDSELRILRFTPMAERVLHLIATDVGRPLGDIKPKIDVPDLEQTVRDVLSSMTERNRVVRDIAGRRYLLRVRPYRTAENRVEGGVVCLVDLDELDALVKTA